MLGQALNPVLLEHSADLYHYARAACTTRHYKCILYQSILDYLHDVTICNLNITSSCREADSKQCYFHI